MSIIKTNDFLLTLVLGTNNAVNIVNCLKNFNQFVQAPSTIRFIIYIDPWRYDIKAAVRNIQDDLKITLIILEHENRYATKYGYFGMEVVYDSIFALYPDSAYYCSISDKLRIENTSQPLDALLRTADKYYMARFPDGIFLLKTTADRNRIYHDYTTAFCSPDNFSFVRKEFWKQFGHVLGYDSGFGSVNYYLKEFFGVQRDLVLDGIEYHEYEYSTSNPQSIYQMQKGKLIGEWMVYCSTFAIRYLIAKKAYNIAMAIKFNLPLLARRTLLIRVIINYYITLHKSSERHSMLRTYHFFKQNLSSLKFVYTDKNKKILPIVQNKTCVINRSYNYDSLCRRLFISIFSARSAKNTVQATLINTKYLITIAFVLDDINNAIDFLHNIGATCADHGSVQVLIIIHHHDNNAIQTLHKYSESSLFDITLSASYVKLHKYSCDIQDDILQYIDNSTFVLPIRTNYRFINNWDTFLHSIPYNKSYIVQPSACHKHSCLAGAWFRPDEDIIYRTSYILHYSTVCTLNRNFYRIHSMIRKLSCYDKQHPLPVRICIAPRQSQLNYRRKHYDEILDAYEYKKYFTTFFLKKLHSAAVMLDHKKKKLHLLRLVYEKIRSIPLRRGGYGLAIRIMPYILTAKRYRIVLSLLMLYYKSYLLRIVINITTLFLFTEQSHSALLRLLKKWHFRKYVLNYYAKDFDVICSKKIRY